MSAARELSVVVLCYRGEENVLPFIEQIKNTLAQRKIDFELILVANYDLPASADRTPQIMRDLAAKDKRCICVATQKNGMMGWDLREGLKQATGRVIAFVDGDGQTPAADILKLYGLLNEKNLDICKIYRIGRAEKLWRRIFSAIFNFLFRILFPGFRIRDINAKPKLITQVALKRMHLTSNDWFIDAEIMLESRRLKLQFAEIPGISGENTWRRSFVGAAAMFEFAKNLLVYRMRYFLLK